jgi:hypothetical protein
MEQDIYEQATIIQFFKMVPVMGPGITYEEMRNEMVFWSME